jgi:hypothetical protein
MQHGDDPGTPFTQTLYLTLYSTPGYISEIPGYQGLRSCAYERIKEHMPSKSTKQRKFMAAAANNPEFAKKAEIPVAVARDFHEEDKKRRQRLVAAELRKSTGGTGGAGTMGGGAGAG